MSTNNIFRFMRKLMRIYFTINVDENLTMPGRQYEPASRTRHGPASVAAAAEVVRPVS
jgi:hypothetical protein